MGELKLCRDIFFYNDVIEVKEPNLWSDPSFLGLEIAHANFHLFVYNYIYLLFFFNQFMPSSISSFQVSITLDKPVLNWANVSSRT